MEKTISVRCAVNRTRAAEEVLKAINRVQHVNDEVAETMPRGEGEEAVVCFFKLDRFISDDKLEEKYELRGLKPADPYSLAAVNAADPSFADEHPNGTHWKDAQGEWCYVAFDRWRDERHVYVGRSDWDWSDHWWLAGLRK